MLQAARQTRTRTTGERSINLYSRNRQHFVYYKVEDDKIQSLEVKRLSILHGDDKSIKSKFFK